MARWSLVPLGQLLSKQQNWITLNPDSDYRQITVRLWGKGVALRGIVKGADIASKNQVQIRSGQFIMSRIDARHGAFGFIPFELDGGIVSPDFPVFELRIDRLAPGFLAWVSKTDTFISLCKAASEGTTNRVRLKDKRFLAQSIPLPPLHEQHRIVGQLDAIADRVARRHKAAQAADAELDSILRAAFQRIAADAPRAHMGEVAPLVRRPVNIEPEGRYPELGIRSFGKGTFHKPTLSDIEIGTKRLFRIEQRDLLFNIVFAWEGAVAVASAEDHGRVGSHRFLTCVPDPGRATSPFLRYFFLSPEGLQRLGEASPGGAGRNRTLGLQALEAIDVPLPSLDAQQWFDTLQTKAAAMRARQTEAAAELDRLLPALLDRAFS